MKVCMKDAEQLKKLVILKGHSHSSLSVEIGQCRGYLNQAFKREVVSPKAASKLADALKVNFNELFDIR